MAERKTPTASQACGEIASVREGGGVGSPTIVLNYRGRSGGGHSGHEGGGGNGGHSGHEGKRRAGGGAGVRRRCLLRM